MVDCGLAQGDDSVMPMEAWPVKPSQVDYLFLTHAHIDHIGRVPELQAAKILKTIDELSWGFEYREKFQLKKGIAFKLGCAGHILVSCFIRFELPEFLPLFFPAIWGSRIRRFSAILISLNPVIY